jgi:protein O-GlcNAc transferase
MMNITETIASDCEEYIAIAVELAKSADLRRAMSCKISSNKYRLYRDRECIEALQQFLEHAARQRANSE